MSENNHTTEKQNVIIGIAIIGVVFFIIGFVSWVNSILIPYFRIACELTNYQSYFVTFVLYSLSGHVGPSGLFTEKNRL